MTNANGTPLLATRQLSAGYGKLAAVRDLDLEVHAGEVVLLLGPNGAGKTTTLKAAAGVLVPMSGAVCWKGRPTRAPVHKRVRWGMSYVPQDRSVIMGLTAAENLRIASGSPDVAIELFPELREHLGRKVGLLSGGQQQMLTLGRALAAAPELLLADELSLGLAPKVVRRLLDAVRAAADRGVGVLLVEQHAHQALAVADRVYVLQRGRVAIESRAADLVDRIDEIEYAYLSGTEATSANGDGPSPRAD